MTSVVSGFNPAGYLQYGRQFMGNFHQHWPEEVRLKVFTEEVVEVPRGGIRSLWTCPGSKEFIERHSGIPERNGRSPVKGWGSKDHRKGYCYRYDAVKFSRQCIIPTNAADESEDGEVLCWLDADTITFKDIPPNFVESFLSDHDICYLGRMNLHSEIGFWAVRLNDRTRRFLAGLSYVYTSDEVFNYPEWHSAFMFDRIRERHSGLKSLNLTPRGHSHVWFQTPLGNFMDHLKGDSRKLTGRSKERREP